MKDQIATFHESVKTSKNIVVCVQCGSTAIDQFSVSSIKCCNCGNSWFWDATRFTIARNADAHDAEEGIDYKRRHFRSEVEDFRSEINGALQPFAHLMSELQVYMDSKQTKIKRAEFAKLAQQWRETQNAINDQMEKLVKSDDLIMED